MLSSLYLLTPISKSTFPLPISSTSNRLAPTAILSLTFMNPHLWIRESVSLLTQLLFNRPGYLSTLVQNSLFSIPHPLITHFTLTFLFQHSNLLWHRKKTYNISVVSYLILPFFLLVTNYFIFSLRTRKLCDLRICSFFLSPIHRHPRSFHWSRHRFQPIRLSTYWIGTNQYNIFLQNFMCISSIIIFVSIYDVPSGCPLADMFTEH